MIIKDVNLETVCGITSKMPENTQPEFAFAGKSNVGKSSLINSLMNRKSYARISAQPGKTQTINFYHINDALYYVDLPGYGYARANVEVKAKWGKMIEDYLHQSKMLRCVFLLIDIRHEPSSNDKLMYDWIVSQGYQPVIIATKADKIKRSQLQKQMKILRTGLEIGTDVLMIPFSAETKQRILSSDLPGICPPQFLVLVACNDTVNQAIFHCFLCCHIIVSVGISLNDFIWLACICCQDFI